MHGNFKHGLSQHRLYRVWAQMKYRCTNKNHEAYKYYGARNITVCDKWQNDFLSFYNFAMDNGWREGLELDREENNKGYYPENCRFITRAKNNRNTRLLRNNNTSGFRGVYFHKAANKWLARITINGKFKHLGSFKSPKLAALRYDVEAFQLNDGRPMNFIK